MKGIKGKLLNKLKSFQTLSTLRKDLVLQFSYQETLSDQDFRSLPSSESISDIRDEEPQLDFNTVDSTSVAPSTESDEFHEANVYFEEQLTLADFEDKCPPGGDNSVIFYSTCLTGIRKTFDDCSAIRFLLHSLKILFQERDVAMHLEYRDELWKVMGGRVVPPRLFIKGRYIGGAEEIVALHEQGNLSTLVQDIPPDLSSEPCNGCAGMNFVLCSNCNGSRKVFSDEGHDELFTRCPKCNENGLVLKAENDLKRDDQTIS